MAAEVHVTTWAELVDAVRGAGAETNIYLDNDIDLNNEYPTGIPTSCATTANVTVRIYGQEYKISNLLVTGSIKGFAGRKNGDTTYWLYIYDVTFDNVQVQATNTACVLFGEYSSVQRCTVPLEGYTSVSGQGSILMDTTASINRSSLTVTGYTGEGVYTPIRIGRSGYFSDYNNIKLLGKFNKVYIDSTRNSYISGDFEQTSTASEAFVLKLRASILNATIKMAQIPTVSSTLLALINTDNLTYPSGKSAVDLPSSLTQVSTEDLQGTTTLKSVGFPIWEG